MYKTKITREYRIEFESGESIYLCGSSFNWCFKQGDTIRSYPIYLPIIRSPKIKEMRKLLVNNREIFVLCCAVRNASFVKLRSLFRLYIHAPDEIRFKKVDNLQGDSVGNK